MSWRHCKISTVKNTDHSTNEAYQNSSSNNVGLSPFLEIVCCVRNYELQQVSPIRRGVKLPSSYLSRIFDSITMHREKLRNSKGGGKLESMKKRLRGEKNQVSNSVLAIFCMKKYTHSRTPECKKKTIDTYST